MKILILYQYSTYDQQIDALCNNLIYNDINVDSLNVSNWRFRTKENKNRSWFLGILGALGKIPKVNGLTIILFRNFVLNLISGKYDIVDIHFLSRFYDKLVCKFKINGNKIKITIWGSDFYRADLQRREEQRAIYQIVDIIQIETRQIAIDFLKVYPEYAEKVKIAHFGILQFDIIDELLRSGEIDLYKKEFEIPESKIVLTCGTNGSTGHQHVIMINEIEKLPFEIKDKIFLVFPMTYGGNTAYIETVRRKANSLGIPYRIFPSFLSKSDLGKLRIISDIMITIQVTDALASAIQEYMYAGNIMIAGDWLPYEILNDNEIFYLTTTKESLVETITDAFRKIDTYRNICKKNKEKLAYLSSWNEAIKEWLSIYHGLDNR